MGYKVKNAISKRRPRQNIISMILKSAKNKSQHSTGSTSASSRSSEGMNKAAYASTSTSTSNRGGDGGKESSGASKPNGRRSNSRSRGIIQSAVELTRRSKRITSRSAAAGRRSSSQRRRRGASSSKRGIPFVKGQRAFYRSAKGIAKVTVVGIHHDAKLVPYYTIQLRDGKEKQTDGTHLTPVVAVVQQEDASSSKKKKSGGGGKSKGDNKSSGESGGNTSYSRTSTADDGHLTELSTEAEGEKEEEDDDEIVIDYGDDYDDDEDEEPQHLERQEGRQERRGSTRGEPPRQERRGSARGSVVAPHQDHGPAAKDEDDAQCYSSAANNEDDEDDNVEEGGEGKKFSVGQDAYYRSPANNGISKISILSYWEGTDRYTINLPDGGHKDNVKPSRLATLMDLTSKELSMLMKERNKRHHTHNSRGEMVHPPSKSLPVDGGGAASRQYRGSSRERRGAQSSSSSRAHQEQHIIIDEGYEAEEGERLSSGSERSNDSSDDLHTTKARSRSRNTSPIRKETTPLLALPCPTPIVQMVQANTEEGGKKMVPLYKMGMQVYYKNASGITKCEILNAHLDDLLDPYYDVRLEDGREKQTDNAHIMLEDEGGGENEVLAVIADEERRGGGGQEEEDREEGTRQREPVSVDKFIAVEERPLIDSTVPKKHHREADTSDRSNDSNAKKASPVDPSAATLVLPAKFCAGDEVLYSSSQGDQIRAAVVRLHRDKKNRPYYVIKLREGKEKQVYGHRLRPYESQDEVRRSRSRSRGASSRGSSKGRNRGRSASKVSKSSRDPDSSRQQKDPPRRSESMDSRKSAMSNSSRRSRASRERLNATAARDESLASSRDGHATTRQEESLASTRAGRGRERGHTGERHSRDESLASSRAGRGRDESLASSRAGHVRDESLASTREGGRHATDPTAARASRSRSKSAVRRGNNPHLTSSMTSHNTEQRGEPSRSSNRHGRERSRSRAPSEESRQTSHHHHASRGFRPTTPSVSMSSKNPSSDVPSSSGGGGDDLSRSTPGTGSKHAGRSIAKLRSFRKGFSAMRKH